MAALLLSMAYMMRILADHDPASSAIGNGTSPVHDRALDLEVERAIAIRARHKHEARDEEMCSS